MQALPKRINIVTLGVSHLAASRAFYQRLGFEEAAMSTNTVAFFQLGATVFGLYGADALAEDATVETRTSVAGATSLAINFESEADVDAALAFAASCGATIAKPAEKVFWGGYSGYFADPDGHLWEIAHNPFAPLDANGQMQLETAPDAGADAP